MTNPFGAPVYHEETVSSTMDAARVLEARGEPHGTVVYADYQESGRGRSMRAWQSAKGANLTFTALFRFGDFAAVPQAFTLRAGLAAALALESCFPALKGDVKIKWPNDIMLCIGETAKKTAGILAETPYGPGESGIVFLGAGINLFQLDFPEELRGKAGSVALALREKRGETGGPRQPPPCAKETLLEKTLSCLFDELEGPNAASWKTRLEERLYKKGEDVVFALGAAGSENILRGRLTGVGAGGGLLITPAGEDAPRPFYTGELRVY